MAFKFQELTSVIQEATALGDSLFISESTAAKIRELLDSGETGLTAIAKQLGITPQQVYQVKKKWQEAQGAPAGDGVTVTKTAATPSAPAAPRAGTKADMIRSLLIAGGKSVSEIANEVGATPTQVYGMIKQLAAAGQAVDIVKRVRTPNASSEPAPKKERSRSKGRAGTAEQFVDDSIYEYLQAVGDSTLQDMIDYIRTHSGTRFDEVDDNTVNALIYRRLHAQMESGGVVYDGTIYRLPEAGEDFDEGDEDFDIEPEQDRNDGIGSLDDDDVTASYVQRYKGKSTLEDDDYGDASAPWDLAASRLGYSKYDDEEDDDPLDDDDEYRLPI